MSTLENKAIELAASPSVPVDLKNNQDAFCELLRVSVPYFSESIDQSYVFRLGQKVRAFDPSGFLEWANDSQDYNENIVLIQQLLNKEIEELNAKIQSEDYGKNQSFWLAAVFFILAVGLISSFSYLGNAVGMSFGLGFALVSIFVSLYRCCAQSALSDLIDQKRDLSQLLKKFTVANDKADLAIAITSNVNDESGKNAGARGLWRSRSSNTLDVLEAGISPSPS